MNVEISVPTVKRGMGSANNGWVSEPTQRLKVRDEDDGSIVLTADHRAMTPVRILRKDLIEIAKTLEYPHREESQ